MSDIRDNTRGFLAESVVLGAIDRLEREARGQLELTDSLREMVAAGDVQSILATCERELMNLHTAATYGRIMRWSHVVTS